jgi:DNA-binding response OmpR family regulator
VNANVLIIDDSLVMNYTLNSILSSHGCMVKTCASGEDGRKHLEAGVQGHVPMPDVLLLDLNMPGLDGMTLLGWIRSDERLAGLPVIIITGETDRARRAEALDAGADDYLCKPVELSDLLTRVKAWASG